MAVGLSVLPVIAQNSTSTTNGKKAPVDLVCMQNAVVKRDNAIIAAADVYVTAFKNSIGVRRDALKIAWTMTNKKARKEAIRKAEDAAHNVKLVTKKAYKNSREAVWATYRSDRKACHGNGDDVSAKGQGQDEL